MARTPGVRFIHVVYEPLEGEPKHDLRCGNECPCEPKSHRISKDTILVVHDPKDKLYLIEDNAILKG